MSIRLVAATTSRPAVANVTRPAATRAAPAKSPRAVKKNLAPVAIQPEAPAVQGVSFAPARIAFGPPSAPREQPPAFQPTPPIHLLQMQAQLSAARFQVADALQRELGSWQTPDASMQGSCTLAAAPGARLACDSEELAAALAARESLLIGLLRAWCGMEPGTQGLFIAVVGERYEARWL